MSRKDSYALVTGASRGIGAAIARRLAAAGWPVLMNYRSNHARAREVASLIEADGGSAELLAFDVRDRDACDAAVASLEQASKPVAVIVNNAGIVADHLMAAMPPGAWEDVTRTTLDGFYNVTRGLLMPMLRARSGRIVNIASVSGVRGNAGQTNYSAAKAGLIGATLALAREVAKRGVTVNAVAPGLIDTEMLDAPRTSELLRAVPMRRLGRASEVAALVEFLVGEDAAYITGQVIGISGGLG